MVAMIHGAARHSASSRRLELPQAVAGCGRPGGSASSPPAGGGWCMIRVPGIFLLRGRPGDVSNEPQDIYMESTMDGEFPGEVL